MIPSVCMMLDVCLAVFQMAEFPLEPMLSEVLIMSVHLYNSHDTFCLYDTLCTSGCISDG